VRAETRYFEKSILCAQYNRLICEAYKPRDESGALLATELTNLFLEQVQEHFGGLKVATQHLNKTMFIKEGIREKVREGLGAAGGKNGGGHRGAFYWKGVLQGLLEELLPFSKHSRPGSRKRAASSSPTCT
jgi:hypothetical protein